MKWIFRIVCLAVIFALACWFWSLDWFSIDPDSVGGWWQGVWQGWAFPCNFVRSFFTDCLYIAPQRTTAYMIFFCLCAISNILGFVRVLLAKGND